jgi:hypothetical protein
MTGRAPPQTRTEPGLHTLTRQLQTTPTVAARVLPDNDGGKLCWVAFMGLSLQQVLWVEEAKRVAGEERCARIAVIYWGPALGAFPRRAHPYPVDAPPLPRRREHR